MAGGCGGLGVAGWRSQGAGGREELAIAELSFWGADWGGVFESECVSLLSLPCFCAYCSSTSGLDLVTESARGDLSMGMVINTE